MTILKCDDDKTAQKAIDALKDGKELQEVYDTYTSADSSFSNEEIVCTTLNTDIPTRLINQAYKTKDTGVIDEVFTMEDNKVKSFIVQKRIILTRADIDNNIVTSVYYDDSNWDSLKATYPEDALYPSKKELLNSL